MCGFVAVLAPDGALPAAVLDQMRERLRHRGPDGHGSWIGKAAGRALVGLGHRRLSIIDLSEAAGQPMFRADGRLVIVYNGEIYNFLELRAELESLGAVFRTRSDTEVLLAAYERWGADCLARLNGMFAFAIWDGRRQELFVARDRFGEKPVFFTSLPNGGVAFASEMKALFAHPQVRASASEKDVQRYVAGTYYEDDERTLFAGVTRLPAAHAIVIDPAGRVLRRWRYWTPDYTALQEGYREKVAIEEFRERMERSVKMRLRADVPVGSSLSGGLDSSFTVCTLARLREDERFAAQHVFSARFDDDPTLSEGPQIDLVVAHTGVKAFSVTPSPLGLAEESRRLHWHQEEPFLSASIYLQWCVMRLARDHNTTVLLDGQGADELLAGYQSYFTSYQLDLLDRGNLPRLWYETRAFRGRLRRVAAQYPDSRRRFNEEIALSWRQLYRYWLRRPPPQPGPYEVGVPPARRGMRLRRQIAEAMQYNTLPVLLRYADRNAMAFGRETRFPFLDYDLVEWCSKLPDRAFVRNGWQKWILRKAGDGLLPPAIQWRADKVGYAAPLDAWLRGALRDWAYERLFSGSLMTTPGYDREALTALWDRHQSRETDVSWPLWRWISLGEWLALLKDGSWQAAGPAGGDGA
jgi:asparagine synthase (glutamine-hydrolysing)